MEKHKEYNNLQAFDLVNSKARCLADLLKVDALVGVGLARHGNHSEEHWGALFIKRLCEYNLQFGKIQTTQEGTQILTEELIWPPDRINTWPGDNFLQRWNKTGEVGRSYDTTKLVPTISHMVYSI